MLASIFCPGLESLRLATIFSNLFHNFCLWGRMASCGRLEIGLLSISRKLRQADFQSAAGYQPAPHLRRSRTMPPLFPPVTQFFRLPNSCVGPALGLEARLGEGAAARWKMDCHAAALTGFQDELHAAAK